MKIPGIPPLLKKINNVANIAILLVADGVLIAKAFNKHPKWGIFVAGFSSGPLATPALKPDSIISLGFKKDWNLPKYPMELGAFQTYNKVTEPYDVKVRMTIGNSDPKAFLPSFPGGKSRIASFLADVEKAALSLDLYDVVTPDATYLNANIYHYDYNRTSTNGVSMLTVDLYLAEVRVTIKPAFSTVVAPTSTAAVNTNAQPTPKTGTVGARQ